MLRADRYKLTVNIPVECHDFLLQVSGQRGRTRGQVVAQLIFEYRARQEERERLRAELAAAGCTHLVAEHTGA